MKFFLVLLTFFCLGSLQAVPERDWLTGWDEPRELPGAQMLPSIDIDEIEDSAISVTYALDGGRFGDQLLNYLKALWLSWKYDLPFVYRPFDYSDQLALSDFHKIHLNEEVIRSLSAQFGYFHAGDIDKTRKMFAYLDRKQQGEKKQILWNVGILTPLIEEHFCEKIDGGEFRELLHQLVRPKNQIDLVSLPVGRKSIAIHVRTGIGYDWELNIRNLISKFPPYTFYLGALQQAIAHFHGEPLYVHIFTDHPNPVELENMFIEACKNWGLENEITFNCRRSGNAFDQNVLEDLFSMVQFDCLIRPYSSLSTVAGIIAAPHLEIQPSHWGEYRQDSEGKPILDGQGNRIVDLLIVERIEKGHPIQRMQLTPIPSSILFPDTEAVRRARLEQNDAMAVGDVERVASFWTEDVTLRRGLGDAIIGKDAYRAIISVPNEQSLVYVREPESIEVSSDWPLAFESGTWTARAGSTPVITGRYSAQWVKREGRWLIRSEVFVALTCHDDSYGWRALP